MRPFRLPVRLAATFASAFLALAAPAVPVTAQDTFAESDAQPLDLSALVAQIDIPYEIFTLDNGLTTIVHTDRKAPIVGVTVYYRVGSKHEPRGRTGFAHLFEHIMFTGSENVANFDIPLEGAGSTPTNGSTWYDRTNYVETVPTGALDLALMMEADRMGYLLGAVTQERLDQQRGVVQNEKRQGDNQPFGLVDYRVTERLLPVGHPYRHSTIGSMADLAAASLEDVQNWFRANYGPNNVVLALTGDIDAATARPMVERWFGAIPRGPDVVRVEAGPVDLPAPVAEEMADQVSQVRVTRHWTGPGLNDPDAVPLYLGMQVLGGLLTSRLDSALVYGAELATSVYAGFQAHEQIGFLSAQFDLVPGGDRAAAEALFDAEIARLIAEGPSEDELRRAATQVIAGQIAALERVGGFGGKGAVLAEGLLYSGDPAFYKRELERVATVTPAEVRAALQRWLSRPAYTLAIVPGTRTLDGALMGGYGDEADYPPPPPDAGGGVVAPRSGPPRELPPPGDVPAPDFPQAERAVLSNGIPVTLVQRVAVPTVTVALTLDAGSVVDGTDNAGRHELMVDMLAEGTTTRSTFDILTAQEELAASVRASAEVDTTTIYLSSLTLNLPQSLELMADITLNPAFDESSFGRVQTQRLAEIAEELTQPGALASRAMGLLLFGAENPYALASTIGRAEVVARLTPADLRAEHARWVRPDLASFTVVGNISMAELLPQLEAAFGHWRAPDTPPPAKNVYAPVPPAATRLVVIDRPNSPQSVLMLGRILPLKGTDPGKEALELANEVLGDGFLSRLNTDLRERRGWTYGVRSSLPARVGPQALVISTSVQADRTADSLRVILDQMEAFPTTRPVDPVELQRVTDGNIRGLPNRFETNGQVLGAMLTNRLLGRPDDYQEQLPAIYRSIGADAINAAATAFLHPRDMAIVVVGDRQVIDPQLEALGVPAEYLAAEDL